MPEAAQQQHQQELKKCPACAELILAEAKKCKHCGFQVSYAEAREALAARIRSPGGRRVRNVLIVLAIAIAGLAVARYQLVRFASYRLLVAGIADQRELCEKQLRTIIPDRAAATCERITATALNASSRAFWKEPEGLSGDQYVARQTIDAGTYTAIRRAHLKGRVMVLQTMWTILDRGLVAELGLTKDQGEALADALSKNKSSNESWLHVD